MRPVLRLCLSATALATIVCGVLVAGQEPLATASGLEAEAKTAEQSGRLQEAFDLYLRAVQALPARGDAPMSMWPQFTSLFETDIRLRERIIALAARVQPLPVAPEAAERFAVRGQVLFKDATDKYGFMMAMSELARAVKAAPWVPIHAFNLALVQEKLGYYKAAAANLKLYVASGAADAADARAKTFELELRREEPEAALREDCTLFYVATACLKLGRELLAEEETSSEGIFALQQACRSGSGEGCLEGGKTRLNNLLDTMRLLGKQYAKGGKGLENAEVLALGYFEQGCTKEFAPACRELGNFYAKDWPELDLKKNKKVAATWYQKSCDLDPVGNKADCERAARLRGR